MIELISIDDRRAWEGALADVPHAFAHTWANCQAMSLTSGDATYLCRFAAAGSAIVCPIAERWHHGFVDIYTPYGFSGFVGETPVDRDFAGAWTAFVQERGYVCGYFSLHPCLDASVRLSLECADAIGVSYVLNLDVSEDQLFAGLDENRRRQLAHFSADSDVFVHDRGALETFVLANYEEFYRTRHASATYDFTPATFSALAARDDVVLVGAASEGHLEAASLFGYTRSAGDYLFNISVPGGRHHSAALIWYGAVKLRTLGVPTLNLGGGVHGYDGVARFKERFGARMMPLRSVRQIYRTDVYSRLCQDAGVDPEQDQRYFPAYRALTVRRGAAIRR